jgi:glycosyltransferase involved in cell wall biosynthesis
MKGFSVIMPTYNQAGFIRRAILSLFQQTHEKWELIIINDGCSDDTEDNIAEYLSDERIVYLKNEKNQGLGFAINQGLDIARYDYIAYLPSDDYYFNTHLQTMEEKLESSADVFLVVSGIKFNDSDSYYHSNNCLSKNLVKNTCLQLVQTAHRKTDERWVERNEFVSEDLFILFWYKLSDKGFIAFTDQVTVNWTNHPHQRYKIISETFGGGIHQYRRHYQVNTPIKLKSSNALPVDEKELYAHLRTTAKVSKNGLKILIVGELAYNPDRILAFEEQGHQLYGLWINGPIETYNTVGPLSFGNVINIPYKNWKEEVKKIQPDIIYALLNASAIPIAHEVLTSGLDIPFVWHFKEGPSLSVKHGTWEKLIDLYAYSDGQIYINPESKAWYAQFISAKNKISLILDGDLPKIDYFTDDFTPLLSETDGEIHTVAPGRVVGISFDELRQLAMQKIHLHLYIQNYLYSRTSFISMANAAMRHCFHLHLVCTPRNWVKEFSQYDAGWLHCFKSSNGGFLIKAGWDDLNMPTRMSTLAAAGLPMLLCNNREHIVASQSRIKEQELGICFDSYENLSIYLGDKERMQVLRNNVLKHRKEFSFDYNLPALIDFFRKVIENKNKSKK